MESGRVLAGALEVGGVRIPDGGTVIVLLASANGRP
jgi:cytochrome P450